MQTLIDFAIAVFVVAGALAVVAGLGPSLDTYDATKDALRAEAKRQRLEAALQDLCGENGVAIEQAPDQYRCYTKRGHGTSVVAEVRP